MQQTINSHLEIKPETNCSFIYIWLKTHALSVIMTRIEKVIEKLNLGWRLNSTVRCLTWVSGAMWMLLFLCVKIAENSPGVGYKRISRVPPPPSVSVLQTHIRLGYLQLQAQQESPSRIRTCSRESKRGTCLIQMPRVNLKQKKLYKMYYNEKVYHSCTAETERLLTYKHQHTEHFCRDTR